MTEQSRISIDKLNDMYCTQSAEFRRMYRDNYFHLLEYIIMVGL